MDPTNPDAWVERGACRGLPTEWFVPSFDPDSRMPPDPRAFEICWGKKSGRVCPVREECLAYAKANKCSGCWGGVALHLGRRRRD